MLARVAIIADHGRVVQLRSTWLVAASVLGLSIEWVGCSGDPALNGRGGLSSISRPGPAGGSAAGAPASGQAGEVFNNSTTPVSLSSHDASAVAPDAGSGPDQKGNCGGVEVEPMVTKETVPGNVLLIFDESLSMNDEWNGGQSKWA